MKSLKFVVWERVKQMIKFLALLKLKTLTGNKLNVSQNIELIFHWVQDFAFSPFYTVFSESLFSQKFLLGGPIDML